MGIVEEKDATDAQRLINLVNSGIYCIRRGLLDEALSKIGCDNAQGEYYLTDIVHIGHRAGWRLGVAICPAIEEVVGINTADDLARVERLLPDIK